MRSRSIWLLAALFGAAAAPFVRCAAAQGTLEDYRRAARILDGLSGPAVDVAEPPRWIGPGRFWYP